MNAYDWIIIGIATVGLGVWVRGCMRSSIGDCSLGLALGVLASVAYYCLFSLTRTAWLAVVILGVFLLSLLLVGRFLRSQPGRLLAVILLVLTTAAGIVEHKFVSAGNALLVIEPYRTGRTWAFDEARLGLTREPFVQGIPEMIDKLTKDIPGSEQSVRLIFSQRPFPGAQLQLDRRHEQDGGNWYYSKDYQMEGWLCPALFKFFPRAPQHIYVKAEQK